MTAEYFWLDQGAGAVERDDVHLEVAHVDRSTRGNDLAIRPLLGARSSVVRRQKLHRKPVSYMSGPCLLLLLDSEDHVVYVREITVLGGLATRSYLLRNSCSRMRTLAFSLAFLYY